ncbi:hypothetical protein CVT25_003374 [Psilocybe cyanescens]|uniref:Uncharacterized protein n=1 Tax=Psilocybe cyanescens TaxID=93625 RepID=A0A409WLX7_PSICY|nr:hypothetical protein CVT25_003374 [Psilocybe cyanescens]
MNQHPSHLSRQEPYSYGFKEGQPWGDDRRAIVSALHAMDQLEREIQQNYIYNRSTPSNPWSPYPSSQGNYTVPAPGATYFQPRAPADIRINRSNASDASQSSSGSEMARWSNHQEEYGYSGFTNGGLGGHSGRPDRHYHHYHHHHHRGAPAATFHRPSAPQSQSYSQSRSGDIYAPPLTPFNSRHSRYHAPDDNHMSLPEEPSNSPQSPMHASQTSSPPDHMLLIGYVGESRNHAPEDPDHDSVPPSSPKRLSPGWSMATTRGSENLSNNSSQGYHSEDSVLSGYSHIDSSGYVESYNVHPQERYHGYVEDTEHEYMSDGVASDEGVYYSSSEDPNDEGGAYSDEGYSSFSDYYEDDDDFYGGDSDSD